MGQRKERQGNSRHVRRKPIVGIAASASMMSTWKDSVITDAELRIWLADGIANGLEAVGLQVQRHRLRSSLGAGRRENLSVAVENEKYLRNEENLARVAMVYSQQTGTYYGAEQKHRRVEDHGWGMYQRWSSANSV